MNNVLKFSFATLLAVTLTAGVIVMGQPQPADAFPFACPPPCNPWSTTLVRVDTCVQPIPGGVGLEYCKTFRDTSTNQLCTTTCVAP